MTFANNDNVVDGYVLGAWPQPNTVTSDPQDSSNASHQSMTLTTAPGTYSTTEIGQGSPVSSDGLAYFAIKTQNLAGSNELPWTSTMIVTVTYNGQTVSKSYTVNLTNNH